MARSARIFAAIDVHYFEDDRILEAGDAWQLHLAAILACKRNLADGKLSRRQLARIAPDSLADVEQATEILIKVGLFVEDGNILVINSWDKWNDSREDVEAMAKGGAYGNHLRWHIKRNAPKDDCTWCFRRGDSPPDSPPDSDPNPREDTDVDPDSDFDLDVDEKKEEFRGTTTEDPRLAALLNPDQDEETRALTLKALGDLSPEDLDRVAPPSIQRQALAAKSTLAERYNASSR